jgi:hypothetical protein
MLAPSKLARGPGVVPGDIRPLILVVLLLAIVPALIAGRGFLDGSWSQRPTDGPVATMVDSLIDGSQKSALLVVASLAFLYFRRFIPILWSLFQQSLSGLLIAIELGIIFWLVYGGLAGIGMPGLFWSPTPGTMMRAAVGVTLFVYWMLYLVFVRDFEVHSRHPERQVWTVFRPVLEASGLPRLFKRSVGNLGATGQLRWFLAYSGLPALLALAIPALLPAMRPGDAAGTVAWHWLFGMALGVLTAAVIVKTRAATRMHELWQQLLRGRIDFRQVVDLDPNRLDPHANTKNILLIIAVIMLVSYVDEYIGGNWIRSLFPPAFSICVMLGVIATFATFLGARRWSTRIAILSAMLVLAAAAGLLEYEVEIRDLHPWYPSAFAQLRHQFSSAEYAKGTGGDVKSLEDYQRNAPPGAADDSRVAREKLLDRWVQSFRRPGETNARTAKPILVVVTTSGGALRAAIWTETVLGYLDQKIDDFPHHVRLLTGASGGMLGAARYVSGHADETGVLGAPGRELDVPDYLAPIAWQIAFRDFFPNSLLPWATYNRGDALEDAWIGYDKGIAHTFGQIKPKEEAGLIPSIIFSPMLVEDGRRILISNLPLHDLAVIHGEGLLMENLTHLRAQYQRDNNTTKAPDAFDMEFPDVASVSAVELFRLLGEESRDNLKLASAVRMSATFPYVTSSVTLPVDPPRHVVDAGYYDNYGVNLAAAWIASHRDWIKKNAAGVLVIQARAFRNERRLKILSEQIHASSLSDGTNPPAAISLERVVGFFPWLASLVAEGVQSFVLPLEGVAEARDSSMYFRNDEQIRGLQRMFTEVTQDKEFFRSVIFTCDTIQVGQEAQNVETLNWYIDPAEFALIRHNMEPYKEADAVAKTGTGRDRNDLRVKSLLEWWRRRECKAACELEH